MDLDTLKYPIGRFSRPEVFTREQHAADVMVLREAQIGLAAALDGLRQEQLATPYREGGWPVKTIVHHLADNNLFAYLRTRLALTEDRPALPSWSPDRFAGLPDLQLPAATSLQLLFPLHQRWTALLEGIPEEGWKKVYLRPGPEQVPWSVEQATALYAWHVRHHTAQILALRQRQGW